MTECGVKGALLTAFAILLLLTAPTVGASPPSYNPISLTTTIYGDGYVWVEYEVEVSPFLPVVELTLFGRNYEDIIAVGKNGLVLDYNITQNGIQVETIGLSSVKISYFTQDLTNKTGRLWTFTIDAPVPIVVKLLPELTVVGLSKAPLTISSVNDTLTLLFPSGPLTLNYIVESSKSVSTQQNGVFTASWLWYVALAAGMVVVVGVAVSIAFKRKRAARAYEKERRIIDVEKIISSRPDLRPDDKEVLRFLAEVGGEAFESELRSRFNLPKTSMWRMVRRLKREGLVDVKKVGGQNLVYIRETSEIGSGTDVPKNS
ncbi:MAG: hypothetical protein QXW32_06615 [Nitrososphaerales archaeon]